MKQDKTSPPPIYDRQLAPRPLGYHLALSSATWLGGAAALPSFLMGLAPIHDSVRDDAEALRKKLLTAPPADLGLAVLTEAQNRISALMAGITAYQQHPLKRTMPPVPGHSLGGTTQLLHYGATPDTKTSPAGVLVIPSLVNPAYILDLSPDHSGMRFLATAGFDPWLVDWAHPGPEECVFDLSDYVTKRLDQALDHVFTQTGGPVHLIGYCMGGNLALALALRHPHKIRSLSLLATPWDFHAESVTLIRALSAIMVGAMTGLPERAAVPLDLLQIFFASLDPSLSDRKFRRFATLDPRSKSAENFVAIEDWANDGMPLARKAAEDCLSGWYGENRTMRGQWLVDGAAVEPQWIMAPMLLVAPAADRIVPPASALALHDRVPKADVMRASSGHVAMVAGRDAESSLWQPLADWLHNR